MFQDWTSIVVSNFDIAMFVAAVFFMLINRLVTKGRVPNYEIIYRWLAFFSVGCTGIYAFTMRLFLLQPTMLDLEVAIANLGFGVIGILSFNASNGFRLATVFANVIWLWGNASVHWYHSDPASSWLWMDTIVPLLLLVCVFKLKRK